MDSVGDVIHKEKNQKKNKKTKGQFDKLIKIRPPTTNVKSINAQPDKLEQREASYIKNIRIDSLLDQLMNEGLLMEDYLSWYAKCCHQLGVSFVRAQAHKAQGDGVKNPLGLFNFLLNKAMRSRD